MMDTTEIFGYLAMTFLVVSFLPTQMRKVRMINLIACALFIVYGVLLGLKWPLIISNAVVCIIQIYHLFFLKKRT
ncbi:MAG: uroporphyrinogen decarboxylase [Proteiniphilum sp.]|nr:uroporphyrinogen decarboxylase [Proteiniphilum sp.]